MQPNKTVEPKLSRNETVKKALEKTEENTVPQKPTIPQGKTEEELREIAQHLQTQMDQHQTATVEYRGALKVVLQMLPEGK